MSAANAVRHTAGDKGGVGLEDLFERLEHVSWVKTISETGWMYSTFSVIHYFTIFVMVGTIVLVDLRVLGLAGRRQNLRVMAAQLFPWMWASFGLAVLSGFIEFSTGAGDFFPDKVFRTKMVVILLAVIFAAIVQRGIPKWGELPSVPWSGKALALVSLLLWLGAILAGVEIAAISGLG